MNLGASAIGILALTTSLLASGTVRGDDFHRVSSDDEYWSLVDTDEGCLWIKVTGEWNYASSEFATINTRKVNWSGSCDKDGLIDGPGALTIENFNSDGLISKHVFKGSASEGFFHETITTETWTDYGDGSGYQEDQGWYDYQYNMGCNEFATDCQPAAGLAFRDSILGGSDTSASSGAAAAQAEKKAPPAPPSIAGATSGCATVTAENFEWDEYVEVWRFQYVLRTQCERDQLFLGEYDVDGISFELPFVKGGIWPAWAHKTPPADLGFKPFQPFGETGWPIWKQREYVSAPLTWQPGSPVPVTHVFVCPAKDDKGYAMIIFKESGWLRDRKAITCRPNMPYNG